MLAGDGGQYGWRTIFPDLRIRVIRGGVDHVEERVECHTPGIGLMWAPDGPHRALSERRRPAVGTDQGAAEFLLAKVEETPDITLGSCRRCRHLSVGTGTVWRRSSTPWDQLQKKPRTPPSVTSPRAGWPGSTNPRPGRLVFIDETGASTKMARCGAARSEANAAVPRSHMDIGRRRSYDGILTAPKLL